VRPALAISASDHAVLVDADSEQICAAKLISLGAVTGYVLLAGGKRVRPTLYLAACAVVSEPEAWAMLATAAVEMVQNI
jgi:geranylgeranyl pyrophosphate synthase